jgi:hypothetical protein
MLAVYNWYADAVIVLDDQVLCIEAKMRATPSAVSQVEFYLGQMIRTPAMQQYMNRPFVPLCLWAIDDPAVSAYARGRGVRVEVFTPSWIEEYMTASLYRTRATNPPEPSGETSGGNTSSST